MLASSVLVAVGLVLLTGGAAFLVSGAASAALRLGLTPLLIGATVVAFGTSAPELVVSVGASLDGAGGIAIGNVVGSNIANAALILGLAALVRPIPTEPAMLRRDLPVMVLATLAAAVVLADGSVGRVEGTVLVVALVGALTWSVRASRSESRAEARSGEVGGVPSVPTGTPLRNAFTVVIGLAGLVAGAQMLVTGATDIAQAVGVSNAVIGLTVVAVGTSLPELATSVVAAWRGDSAIAAGNVVGSNLFNVLGILGVAALARPLVAPGLRPEDLAVLLGVTVAAGVMMWTGRTVGRTEGAVLVAGYAAYIVSLV